MASGEKKRDHPTYRSYHAMLWRNNPKNKQDYQYYANVGVCERWRGVGGYERFLEDVGERPPGMTLDRIDNEKPYEPGNCRWADRQLQAMNRRSNVIVEWNGEKRVLTDLCNEIGIRAASVLASCYRTGCTAEEAARRLYQKKIGAWVRKCRSKRKVIHISISEQMYELLQKNASEVSESVPARAHRILNEWLQAQSAPAPKVEVESVT